jgi:hypothetical protein
METTFGIQDHRITHLPHKRKMEGREEGLRGRGSSGSLLVAEMNGQQAQFFIGPIPTGSTGGLNVPVPVA